LRSNLVFSSVKLTNTGTVPKGFITENNAVKIKINSSIFFPQICVIFYSLK
jgi:hypothetical protein